MSFTPDERPRIAVAADGTLAAIQEPSKITIVEVSSCAQFAELGTDPNALEYEVAWVGTPPRLLVLSRFDAHSTVHLVDPFGPRSIAELQLDASMKLYAAVGNHALVVSNAGAAVLTASDKSLAPHPFPVRAIPVAAGAAGSQFVVALSGAIEEWDPQTRMPRRRLKLPRPASITSVGGSDRVVWMTTKQEPSRIDVIPFVNRGQPKAHDLPEPIASITSHPRSDVVACIGATSGRVWAVDLDGRAGIRLIGPEGIDRADAIGMVLGRVAGVLAAQAHHAITIVTLDQSDADEGAVVPRRTGLFGGAAASEPLDAHDGHDQDSPTAVTLATPPFQARANPPSPRSTPSDLPSPSSRSTLSDLPSPSSLSTLSDLPSPSSLSTLSELPSPYSTRSDLPSPMSTVSDPPSQSTLGDSPPASPPARPSRPAAPPPIAPVLFGSPGAGAPIAKPGPSGTFALPATGAPIAKPGPSGTFALPATPSAPPPLAKSAPPGAAADTRRGTAETIPFAISDERRDHFTAFRARIDNPRARIAEPFPALWTDSHTAWRDDLAMWAGAVAADGGPGGTPPPSPLDMLFIRYAVSYETSPALALLYGFHLRGHDGASPLDIARVLGGRWDEALGRGELAQRSLATYRGSRVRLAEVVVRALDELPPQTGVLFGTPGVISLLGPCVIVAKGPLSVIAEACLPSISGAILAAGPDVDPADLIDEARAYGAAPLWRVRVEQLSRVPAEQPIIFAVDDDITADLLGVPRLT